MNALKLYPSDGFKQKNHYNLNSDINFSYLDTKKYDKFNYPSRSQVNNTLECPKFKQDIQADDKYEKDKNKYVKQDSPAQVLNIGDVIKDRWQITRKIGGGGFGDIYEAIDTKIVDGYTDNVSKFNEKFINYDEARVAIKVEPCYENLNQEVSNNNKYGNNNAKALGGAASKQVLKMEVFVLKRLQAKPNFCKLIGCGRNESFSYMVMSLKGRNLAHLRRLRPNGAFSPATVSNVGIQILKSLKDLHESGFLHRDVKPSNFSVSLKNNRRRFHSLSKGNNTDEDTSKSSTSQLSPPLTKHENYNRPEKCPDHDRTIYALDFGLARQYVDSFGKVRPPRPAAGFRGTVRYASINAHRNYDLSLRDDLWSFFYMLVEFTVGYLPWRKVKDKERVAEIKQNCDFKSLLACPSSYPFDTFNFNQKEFPKLQVVNFMPEKVNNNNLDYNIQNGYQQEPESENYLPELYELYEYLNTLTDYYYIPDYDFVSKLLEKWRDRIGADADTPYDWEKPLPISFTSTTIPAVITTTAGNPQMMYNYENVLNANDKYKTNFSVSSKPPALANDTAARVETLTINYDPTCNVLTNVPSVNDKAVHSLNKPSKMITTPDHKNRDLLEKLKIPNFSSTFVRIKKPPHHRAAIEKDGKDADRHVHSNNLDYYPHRAADKFQKFPKPSPNDDKSGEQLLREYLMESPDSNEIIIPIPKLKKRIAKVFFPCSSHSNDQLSREYNNVDNHDKSSQLSQGRESDSPGAEILPQGMFYNKKIKSKSIPADNSTLNFSLAELKNVLFAAGPDLSNKKNGLLNKEDVAAQNILQSDSKTPNDPVSPKLISHNYVINNTYVHTQIKCTKSTKLPHSKELNGNSSSRAIPQLNVVPDDIKIKTPTIDPYSHRFEDSGRGTSEPLKMIPMEETTKGRNKSSPNNFTPKTSDLDENIKLGGAKTFLHSPKLPQPRIYSSNETGYIDMTFSEEKSNGAKNLLLKSPDPLYPASDEARDYQKMEKIDKMVSLKAKNVHIPRRTKSIHAIKTNLLNNSYPTKNIVDVVDGRNAQNMAKANYHPYMINGLAKDDICDSISTKAFAETDLYNDEYTHAATLHKDCSPKQLHNNDILHMLNVAASGGEEEEDVENGSPKSPHRLLIPWDKIKIDTTPKNLYSRRMKHHQQNHHKPRPQPANLEIPGDQLETSIPSDNIDPNTIHPYQSPHFSPTKLKYCLQNDVRSPLAQNAMPIKSEFPINLEKKRQSLPYPESNNPAKLIDTPRRSQDATHANCNTQNTLQRLHSFIVGSNHPYSLQLRRLSNDIPTNKNSKFLNYLNSPVSNIKDKIALFNNKSTPLTTNYDKPCGGPCYLSTHRFSKPEFASVFNKNGCPPKIMRSKSFANPSTFR